jgi:hypothetical protein
LKLIKSNVSGQNYSSCGFYYHSNSGTLYSERGDSYKSYHSPANFQANAVIGCKWNQKKGEIKFYLDKKDLGVAYSGLDKKL